MPLIKLLKEDLCVSQVFHLVCNLIPQASIQYQTLMHWCWHLIDIFKLCSILLWVFLSYFLCDIFIRNLRHVVYMVKQDINHNLRPLPIVFTLYLVSSYFNVLDYLPSNILSFFSQIELSFKVKTFTKQCYYHPHKQISKQFTTL